MATNASPASGSSLLPLYAICPPGLAGANCTQATCGSPYVDPAHRAPKATGQKSCSNCTDGFTGLNCNVCNTADSCAQASTLTGNHPTVAEGAWITMRPDEKTFVLDSDELTCHRQPKAYTTTHMQCKLVHPTFSSIFPGEMVLTMTKIVNPDRSDWIGIPSAQNSTQADSTLSEVWLDGELQFYCQATGCSSSNGTAIDNGNGHPPTSKKSDMWHCDNLQCACIPGTKVCGPAGDASAAASSGLAIAPIINSLNGSFDVPCNYIDNFDAANGMSSCQFKAGQLVGLLGDGGVPLEQCQFGSCLLADQLEHEWNVNSAGSSKDSGQTISRPVAGGISVLVIVVAALLALLLCGIIRRHRARFRITRRDVDPAVGLKWAHVSYSLQGGHRVSAGRRASSRFLPAAVKKRFAQKQEAVEFEVRGHSVPTLSISGGKRESALLDGSGRKKYILQGISGTAAPGSLVAILGPSGAGKTTLVELFAGREKSGTVSGSIFLQAELDQTLTDKEGEKEKKKQREKGNDSPEDGTALRQVPSALADSSGRRLIAFVDQDDQLPAHSTVREALLFAADLSLPENIPRLIRAQSVDRVIAALGLERVQNSLIGSQNHRGVSGGERRRVSIGVALVANPRVLILDEPLSGLDAYNALRVIEALRSLAHKGPGATTVILTLHQPSSDIFHKFDKAIVVTQGQIMYDGSPEEALTWSAAKDKPCPPGYNIADHLLDLAMMGSLGMSSPAIGSSDPKKEDSVGASPRPDGLQRSESTASSKRSVHAVGTASTSQSRVTTSRLLDIDIRATKSIGRQHSSTVWFTQFAALLKRYFTTMLRDVTGPAAHLVLHVIVGLTSGGAFYQVKDTIGGFQNRIGSIYFLFLMMAFASMSAITHLAVWRPLMIRERANRFYSPFTWLAAHCIYDLVCWRLVPGLLLVVIMYTMIGLRHSARYFFEYLLIAEVFYMVISIYMMILSTLHEELSVAVLLGGAFILFNIGMGGFLLNLDTLPRVIRWVQWICPLKYALEAVAINEVDGLQIKDSLNGLDVSIPASLIAPGLFGLNGSYYRDLLVLALAWLPGLALILTWAAWWRLRDRR